MAYFSLAPFSFEQRLVVQSTDDIRNGKTSQASQPTVMGVLKSMELQYDLDPRGRHLAKAAGLRPPATINGNEWSTENGMMVSRI